MKIRQSYIQTYAKCPEQFRLKYINPSESKNSRQSAAASYGSVLHFALQTYWLNEQDIELAKRTFEYHWNHPESMGCAPDYYLPGTSWANYFSHGFGALDEYHKEQKAYSSDNQTIGVEIDFELPMGDHTLIGSIDKLRVKTDKKGITSLDVADWKTGKVPTFLRYNVQFTAYSWAVTQREFWNQITDGDEWYEAIKDLPVSSTWIDLKSVPFREIDAGYRDEADYVRLEKTVQSLARSIEHQVYVPTLTGDSCAYCDFYQDCGLTRGTLLSEKQAAELVIEPGEKSTFGW